MNKNTKMLVCRVDQKLHNRIKSHTAEIGYSIQDFLREMILKYMEEEAEALNKAYEKKHGKRN